MINDFMTREKERSGITCSVFHVDNILYNDFVEEFGRPHFTKDGNAEWLYKMYNGEKISIKYDKNNFILNKMRRLKLKSHGGVSLKEIDELEVMGSRDSVEIFISILLFLFPLSRSDYGNRHTSIKKVFND